MQPMDQLLEALKAYPVTRRWEVKPLPGFRDPGKVQMVGSLYPGVTANSAEGIESLPARPGGDDLPAPVDGHLRHSKWPLRSIRLHQSMLAALIALAIDGLIVAPCSGSVGNRIFEKTREKMLRRFRNRPRWQPI